MDTRPKVKLTFSPLDARLELTGKIFLIVMWALTLYVFIKLPTTVPIHFNASGKPNKYGSKLTILLLPIIATIIFFVLTWLNKYPHIFNYMTKITADNAQRQYTIAKRKLRFLKLAIPIVFSLIILFIYFTSIGVTKGLGFWFLLLTFGFILIPVIISLSQSLTKKNTVA
jgi:uncharacterized membrane protein